MGREGIFGAQFPIDFQRGSEPPKELRTSDL